jgi:hypothetical protein
MRLSNAAIGPVSIRFSIESKWLEGFSSILDTVGVLANQ